jgi:predicted NBD/HSP70 family sugar kinase
MHLDFRQRQLLHRLFVGSSMSRLEVAQAFGITPNAAGDLVAGMIRQGLLREGPPSGKGRGRPRIPVEIDTGRKALLGIAITAGSVQLAEVDLRGRMLSPGQTTPVSDPTRVIPAVRKAIAKKLHKDHLAIGLSTPGFVDPQQKLLLLSAATAPLRNVDLSELYEAAGHTELLVQNDMHALAARWTLTQAPQPGDDVLVIRFDDGQIGAALLINGKPVSGSVLAANELGHTRLPVATDRCFCGQTGCLERIFSSEYARARLGLVGTLSQMVEHYDGRPGGLTGLIELLAIGLSNAANFVRPARIVLVSSYTRYTVFANELLKQTRARLLEALADRVRIDLWEQPASTPAETAAYIPLAAMTLEGWA